MDFQALHRWRRDNFEQPPALVVEMRVVRALVVVAAALLTAALTLLLSV